MRRSRLLTEGSHHAPRDEPVVDSRTIHGLITRSVTLRTNRFSILNDLRALEHHVFRRFGSDVAGAFDRDVLSLEQDGAVLLHDK